MSMGAADVRETTGARRLRQSGRHVHRSSSIRRRARCRKASGIRSRGRLLALTFTTGIVDAASYLGLGRVFTANMTGNVVLLGFGIAGSAGLPVVAPMVSLGRSYPARRRGGGLLGQARQPARPACGRRTCDPGGVDRRRRDCSPRPSTVRRGSRLGDVVIGALASAMGVTERRPHGGSRVPDLPSTVVLTPDLDRPGRRLLAVRGLGQGHDARGPQPWSRCWPGP